MKRNKLIKELSLGIVSLGLLTGIGISGNVSVNASSNVAGDISQQDLNQFLAETSATDAQSERAQIESGIQMDKQYPNIAAYDAATDTNTFNKYKNQILPYYSKKQMKEFIYDFSNDSDAPEGWTIDAKGNIHKPNTHKKARKSTKVIKHGNHKRARKPRRKITKHVKRTKKHVIKRHRAKRIKRVVRKHTTHKANNYNYLGTYKQGSNQARNDYKSQRLSGLSKKSLFNHLIRNKKLKSSKYLDGYDDKFINMGNVDEDSDFADEVTQMASFAQEYLRDNYPTRSAISNYFTHAKPSRYLRHNRQYKKEFSYLYNNY